MRKMVPFNKPFSFGKIPSKPEREKLMPKEDV